MSHFSQLKTRLTQTEILKKSLLELGFQVVEGSEGQVVRGFMGETVPAEFKVLTDTHYDIGFQRTQDGSYEVVGDWELLPRVSGISQQEFMKSVKRAYAKQTVLHHAMERGYEVQMEEREGVIEMVVNVP